MSDTAPSANSLLVENRFELELEFIQSLASPAYLHHLATQAYFQDPAFISFLRYLQYWKSPEYAKYIKFPHCLYFLELLCDNDTFRKELVNVPFRNFLHEQQFYNWQYRSRYLYGSGVNEKEDESGKETEAKSENNDNNAEGLSN
jgi:mediator of RNA polymerase II transcription subunit 31